MKFILPKDLKAAIYYLQDKEGVWILKKLQPKRTNLQNRYMHAIFNLIGHETGYTMEEIKQIYKRKYLSYRKEVKGKFTIFVTGTHELDTKEMTDFIEKIRNQASADLGIYIPSSDERGFDDFMVKYDYDRY